MKLQIYPQLETPLMRKVQQLFTHGVVTLKLDYGNSLTYCLPNSDLQIVTVIKCCSMYSSKVCRYGRIPAIRKKLHWLPIKARIASKILIFT